MKSQEDDKEAESVIKLPEVLVVDEDIRNIVALQAMLAEKFVESERALSCFEALAMIT